MVLNFTRETHDDIRNPTIVDGMYLGISSLWNTTTLNTSALGWFDYYHCPMDSLEQLAMIAFFQDNPATSPNASVRACGYGWDCSFTVKFTAPGYKCDDIIAGKGNISDSTDSKAPFDTSVLLPEGDYSFFALTQLSDYADQQLKEVSPGGMPLTDPPWPAHLGVFRTEPVLWIGYSSTPLPFEKLSASRTVPGWNDSFTPNIIRCENYETEYTVKFEYVNGFESIRVMDRKYVAPILNTTLTQDVANDGTQDTTVAAPESAYVFPQDKRYKYVAAYHSFGSLFRKTINGTINVVTASLPVSDTQALFTRLFNRRQSYLPFPDLKLRIQSLFENLILSVFSNPQFTIVTWAAAPDRLVGPLQSDGTSGYPCTRSKAQNRFHYHAQDLWIVHGISLGSTVAAVAMGTISVVQNKGVLKNTRYSSIAVLLQHCGIEYDVLGARSEARTREET